VRIPNCSVGKSSLRKYTVVMFEGLQGENSQLQCLKDFKEKCPIALFEGVQGDNMFEGVQGELQQGIIGYPFAWYCCIGV
jgi:hypothetical protein